MIYEVRVTNALNAQLPLTLTRPETSGLIVKDIQGLGPVKANINMRDNSGVAGSTFNSARTPFRNIVFTLEFLELPTIEATRLRTYTYFQTESLIRLDFVTDAGTFHISGYVESNEPNIFSEKETTVISIICPNPDFIPEVETVSGEIIDIAGLFSFPFSNEGETPDIILGERFFQSVDFVIPFIGTKAVGPKLIITADGGAVDNPVIYFYEQAGVAASLEFVFTEALPALADGDRLEIVCERPNRSIQRYIAATGLYQNYVGALALDSSWPVLQPGDNLFSYDAETGAEYIRFSYEYSLRHSGI